MMSGRVFWRGREIQVIRHDDGRLTDPGGSDIPPDDVILLPPSSPSKIVCVGRNYRDHAKELGNPMPERPLIFLKPPSSVLSPGGTILLPGDSSQVEYEGEIGLVISKTCRRLGPEDDPMSFVAGATPINDVTARDLQRSDVQFTRAKSFDTFCPFGPWIRTVEDPDDLEVRTFLNGKLVQEGHARDMAFRLPHLLRFISGVMTLVPGDLIATGTPAGVGKISDGDLVAVEVAGIRLENRAANER
jgi:2-keto-4-pentenoate hydratase/2-oxohepta-3-ene-1,7-dioic acid hydratase in catechol pathway